MQIKYYPAKHYQLITKSKAQRLTKNDLHHILDICQKSNEEQIIMFSVIKDKTIVLTGSFLPYAFKDSDAEFNIGMAISAVQILNRGIYVSLNGIIAKHNELQRDDSGKYHT